MSERTFAFESYLKGLEKNKKNGAPLKGKREGRLAAAVDELLEKNEEDDDKGIDVVA